MSKQIIDSELLSKKRENIFDEYYNHIEAIKLGHLKKQETTKLPDYELLEKSLQILERNIDDLVEEKTIDSKYFQIINEETVECLTKWFQIFIILSKQPNFIKEFCYNIQAIAVLIVQSKMIESIEFRKDIVFFYPSRKDKKEFEKINTHRIPKQESILSELSNIHAQLYTQISKFLVKIQKIKEIKKDNEFENKIGSSLDDIIKHTHFETEKKMEDLTYMFNQLYQRGHNKIKSNEVVYAEVANEFVLLLAKQLNINYSNNIFKFIDLIKSKENTIERYRESLNKNDIHSILHNLRFDEKKEYEWDISVTIEGDEFNSAQIGFLMWSMSKALEHIEGVEVELDDWGNGSKKFNLIVKIKNLLAKEEVKEILDKGRKAAEAEFLNKPVVDVEKTKAEIEKINKESASIPDKEEAKIFHKLEIQNKKLDIELKKFQLIKGYSELIKQGILINDSNIQIKINEILFIEKKDSQLTMGDDIEIIQENEVIKDKPKNEAEESPIQ